MATLFEYTESATQQDLLATVVNAGFLSSATFSSARTQILHILFPSLPTQHVSYGRCQHHKAAERGLPTAECWGGTPGLLHTSNRDSHDDSSVTCISTQCILLQPRQCRLMTALARCSKLLDCHHILLEQPVSLTDPYNFQILGINAMHLFGRLAAKSLAASSQVQHVFVCWRFLAFRTTEFQSSMLLGCPVFAERRNNARSSVPRAYHAFVQCGLA